LNGEEGEKNNVYRYEERERETKERAREVEPEKGK
jgi:hypothetical protein